MSLPSYKEVPVCKRHSLKGLYSVIAEEYDLTDWNSLDVSVRRSKRRVYDYLATELNMVSWYELDVPLRRSTRLLYNFIVVCADPTTPTLTVIVNGTDGALTGATVVIGEESETTGSDGKASFDLEYGDYEATISCSGYTSATEELKFRSNKKTFTITLEESTATSGTLTVTTVDSTQAPVEGSMVFASDEQYNDFMTFMEAVEQDPTIALGIGASDSTGEALLMTMGESFQPVEPTITFEAGNHYIYALSSDMKKVYIGTVSINGDTTTTITLTPIEGGK